MMCMSQAAHFLLSGLCDLTLWYTVLWLLVLLLRKNCLHVFLFLLKLEKRRQISAPLAAQNITAFGYTGCGQFTFFSKFYWAWWNYVMLDATLPQLSLSHEPCEQSPTQLQPENSLRLHFFCFSFLILRIVAWGVDLDRKHYVVATQLCGNSIHERSCFL